MGKLPTVYAVANVARIPPTSYLPAPLASTERDRRPEHTNDIMAIIGIDLGGTKLAGALFDESGVLMRHEVASLSGREGVAVGDLISEHVGALLADALQQDLQANAVGVSIPGIYRSGSGTVWAPNIPGWDDYPLRAELESIVGGGVRVCIDSDRACSILGETWQGAARGCSHAIFLAVGTGIGAGILVDGRILRGRHDIAGAIGWLALDRPYRAQYDACGCFEYHASGIGLARTARDLLEQKPELDPRLRLEDAAQLTAREIFSRYDDGDPLAAEVLNVAVGFWGMTVANLVSLFDPELIIFGGGIFGPAAHLLDRIRTEAEQWGQPISMRLVKLAVSQLGGDAALYGAARLAMDE